MKSTLAKEDQKTCLFKNLFHGLIEIFEENFYIKTRRLFLKLLP